MGMGIIFLLWITLALLSLRWIVIKEHTFDNLVAYLSSWIALNILILLGFIGYFIYYLLNYTQ